MRVHALASDPRFARHVAPVMAALPPEVRGAIVSDAADLPPGRVMVADAARDLRAARARWPVVLMEHGVQTYAGATLSGPEPPGSVALYLAPGPHMARAARARLPGVPVVEVGCPALDTLRAALAESPATPSRVVVSFRFSGRIGPPEAWSAAAHYAPALAELGRRLPVLGHGHPRGARWNARLWTACGIDYEPDFARALARAAVYVADTSSTLYEAAAMGVPVVALNAPWYRRDVHHGLRWWDAIPGVAVDDPADLEAGIARAVADGPAERAARARAVAEAYHGAVDGRAAERAAAAIVAAL